MKKVLLTATVQSHICQFHKPLVELLHQKGCEVHVAARDNLGEKNGLKLDFADRVYDVSFSRSPTSADNIRAYKQLKKIIDEEKYELIHCNTPMGGVVTRLASKRTRRNGTQIYYTAHGFHFYKGAPKMNWIFFYPIEKLLSKITDKLITINHEDYELAKNKFDSEIHYMHGVGVDEERYCVVDEEEKKKVRKELGFDAKQKIILCIGELLPNKNQTMAIQMMKQICKMYSDAVLLLAGVGPKKEKLEEVIVSHELQNNVKLLGYCTCLEKYQQIADVSVSCSKREGLPLNIVEAMLSGNPVVATKNRGHCELIQNGETGYLVDVDDVETMGKYVEALLTDETLRNDMGNRARKFAEQYGFCSVKLELSEIYKNI